jgi:hypothetical protein
VGKLPNTENLLEEHRQKPLVRAVLAFLAHQYIGAYGVMILLSS